MCPRNTSVAPEHFLEIPCCIVKVLLQRCFNKLQQPVGAFVTALLDDRHGVEASELKDHVHALVFELHKTQPALMLYILPRLVDYLEVNICFVVLIPAHFCKQNIKTEKSLHLFVVFCVFHGQG